MGIPFYGQNKDGDALDKALNGGYGDYAGVDIADSTDALAMNSSDFGRTFLCLLDGAAKTVTLPANVAEADIGKQIKPYVANEVALNPHDFGTVLDKNKFRVGLRHKANEHVKLDPHIFIQNQRKNNWALEYGPTLRLDINF